jgi:hypothetical protein
MFRKALEMEVFGWTSLVNILKNAVDRWGVKQIKRLTKEYFDQSEFRTLWSRLCQVSDISMQLQGKLELREIGITLPKGSDRTYFKRVKSLTNPKERAKAMILLQRTQELPKEDWDVLRKLTEDQFGKEEFGQLLKMEDAETPKPKAQEAPTFWRKNLILAALRREESGGSCDWEERIPRMLDLIRSGSTHEAANVMKELGVGQPEQLRVARKSRQCFKEWEKKRQEIDMLMNTNAELFGLVDPRACQAAQENRYHICQDWRIPSFESEEVMWEQVREILDKWEWYGRALDLAQQEMWHHWQRNLQFEKLRASPYRWLSDWTPEMIQAAEIDREEESWSLDCWVYLENQWSRYCFLFEDEDILEDVWRVIDRLAREKGIRNCYVWQFKETGDGSCWHVPRMEDLRDYPCIVLCPRAPGGLFGKDEVDYIPGEYWERDYK